MSPKERMHTVSVTVSPSFVVFSPKSSSLNDLSSGIVEKCLQSSLYFNESPDQSAKFLQNVLRYCRRISLGCHIFNSRLLRRKLMSPERVVSLWSLFDRSAGNAFDRAFSLILTMDDLVISYSMVTRRSATDAVPNLTLGQFSDPQVPSLLGLTDRLTQQA